MGADEETTPVAREAADAPANRVTAGADSVTTSRHDGGSEDIEDESGSDIRCKLFTKEREVELEEKLRIAKDAEAAQHAAFAAALRQEAVPAAPPAPPQKLTIKECLKKPGVYIYHVSCLAVELDGQEEECCVVKVGMTIDNTIDGRLQGELLDIQRWRGSPEPHFTTRSLDGDDNVGDLVACLHGPVWSGSEKKIGRRLGLPLGTGKVVWGSGVEKMIEEHQLVNENIQNQQSSKISVWGWNMYCKEGGGPESNVRVGKSQIGPTEFIMMPRKAMERLREEFKKNPASFASTFQDTNVDSETGPVWDLINDITLPPDWPNKRATVQFKEEGLIDPLTLKLCQWDEKKGTPLKPSSELLLDVGARIYLDGKAGKGRGRVKAKTRGWWWVVLDGESSTKSARARELKVLPDSEEEG